MASKSRIIYQYRYDAGHVHYDVEVSCFDEVWGILARNREDGTEAFSDFGYATHFEALGAMLFNACICDSLIEVI